MELMRNKNIQIISFSCEQGDDAFEIVKDAGYNPVVWKQKASESHSTEELIAYWNGVNEKPRAIIMGADVAITEEFLVAAPELEAISLNCAGYDHVDIDACKKHNVKVCNVPRRNFDAVADFAWGQILALMRNLVKGDYGLRQGKWVAGVERSSAVSRKTLGIIGMGAIGQAVAKRATGFDMRIIAISTSKNPEIAKKYNLEFLDDKEFFNEADIVVICCPHNEQTDKMICKETIGWMKQSAFLINPSRGGIVDTEALYKALKDGTIKGAALDVFEEEPLFESRLFELDNVLLTPHIGGLADREIDNVAKEAAGNCILQLSNQPVNSSLY